MPTAPRAPAAAPPTRVERLPPGQQRLLWLDEGTELRCLHGILRLRPAWVARGELPLLGDRELPASRAWRSDRGQWLQVAALQPSLYRLEAASLPVRGPMVAARQAKENHPEPRGTGWLMETAAGGLRRMAAALRRGRRAA